MNNLVREWYMRVYPTDDCGNCIDPNVTFKDVHDALLAGCDVYRVIGVVDSWVRELVFSKLAKLLGVKYNAIYELWLKTV